MYVQLMSSAGYLERILRARVYDVANETPLERAPRLSSRLGNEILIKREDLQPVFSFKLRGAYNKIANLSKDEQQRGVITASAGNHAQGVALAAQRLGIRAVICMPTTTPPIKVNAVRDRGGEVVLIGDGYDDAYAHALKLQAEQGLTFVHPFDDPDVIAGQGTVAMEILRQHRGPIDAVFVPVGGGGLLAGMAVYIKHLFPEIKVIGVEADESACLRAALDAGERVRLPQVGLFADGVSVKLIGEEPFRLAREYVDDVIVVDTDAICAAIKDIFDDTRSIAEPAGALGLAGLKAYAAREKLQGKTLITVSSGANMNFDRLRHVAERAELGEQREGLFAVTIPEKPGSFQSFCAILGGLPITEFNYRYGRADLAHIFVGVGLSHGSKQRAEILDRLQAASLPVTDLTGNEMAKLHVRFMVGGRCSADRERLYRFEFPERPGALIQFLTKVGGRWNISLFHYRNHGAAFGRVLAGLQVPESQLPEFERFLHELGYPYVEETHNPSYQLFLR
ncbi:MAG TPA: threonine ammonia-lyase, biosynthetic [Polyangiales bacterium]|nr:threonine ammonia-lyase, biosynthetic [Polyangiales bacterium]